MDLTKFIPEALGLLVAVLYIVGTFLKDSPKVQDWSIPWVLTVLGVAGSCGLQGFNTTAVLQGIACAGVSVLTNQLKKQVSIKKVEDSKEQGQ
ncbi:phage holin family protein [Clostridium sardiniense]|uniref:phage holin family protein n=1 Tax=Clostridium sardiniense TaxID=29369 RepID=UPI003D344279